MPFNHYTFISAATQNITIFFKGLFILPLVLILSGSLASHAQNNYHADLQFMREHQTVLELAAPDQKNARIMILPGYQARVMTSTSTGMDGKSYGWINYAHIASDTLTAHMNAFGGEERFWLSPEGGQYSIYFKPNDPFDFDHWQTPAIIDTEAFKLVSKSASEATFSKRAKLMNYSGTKFKINIRRTIKVLDRAAIKDQLNMELDAAISVVAYQSNNTVTNRGKDWTLDNGTLGIWILGMYNPSEKTTLIAPYQENTAEGLTDDYFGKVPSDRLQVKDAAILFKGDGHHRGKIGLAPTSAQPIAGAWDADNQMLTIVQFDLDAAGAYLKSTWEKHEHPYQGDAFNAYNDGPTDDGTQMGPFIELESNSSTRALKKGESLQHLHRTFHFEGTRTALDQIAKKMLGMSLDQIEQGL